MRLVESNREPNPPPGRGATDREHAFAVYCSTEPVAVAWKSSEPGVLAVEPSLSGMTAFLTPVSRGTAVVTARTSDRSAQLTFTVTPEP